MSSDILAAFLPKLLHRVPEHANAMWRHITNEDAGVARRPSAYALFCSDVSLTGVSERSTRRLNRKTPVKSAAAMQHKWQLGNMFMIIVLNFQYFGFRSFFVLPPKVLMRRCFEENLDSKSLWPPGAKVASLERRDLLEESEIYTPAFSEAYNFNIEIQFYGKFTGCGLPTGVNWTYRRLEIWCADLTCFDLLCLSQVSPGFNWFQLVSACGFAILICQFGAKFTCDKFVIVLCTEVPCGFSFQISNVIFRYCDAWFDKLMWFSWHEPGKTIWRRHCFCLCVRLLQLIVVDLSGFQLSLYFSGVGIPNLEGTWFDMTWLDLWRWCLDLQKLFAWGKTFAQWWLNFKFGMTPLCLHLDDWLVFFLSLSLCSFFSFFLLVFVFPMSLFVFICLYLSLFVFFVFFCLNLQTMICVTLWMQTPLAHTLLYC